jgi:hypothetical protein
MSVLSCYSGQANPGKSQGGHYAGEVLFRTQNARPLTRGSQWTIHRRFCRRSRPRWILAGERGRIPARCGPPRPLSTAPWRHFSRHRREQAGGIPPPPATLSVSIIERWKSQPPCVFRREALSRPSVPNGYLRKQPLETGFRSTAAPQNRLSGYIVVAQPIYSTHSGRISADGMRSGYGRSCSIEPVSVGIALLRS